MRRTLALVLTLAVVGCTGAGPAYASLAMRSFGASTSSSVTGEGSADVEGTLHGKNAQGVQVVIVLDDDPCDPNAEEWTPPPYVSTSTLDLGDLDGDKDFEATVRSQRGPLEDRYRVWAFATATNVAERTYGGCASL